jgi:hypothetical protein
VRFRHAFFREKATATLEGFSLYPHRGSHIASYSKGMRQRIVLIAALMHDPELLVLDEPFSYLDVTTALVTRLVIELLAAKGKAVFFSSPVSEQVEKMCTHLVALNRRSVVAAGPIGEMQAGFAGQSLEAGFMQLTEQVDAGRIAESIAAAAPVRWEAACASCGEDLRSLGAKRLERLLCYYGRFAPTRGDGALRERPGPEGALNRPDPGYPANQSAWSCGPPKVMKTRGVQEISTKLGKAGRGASRGPGGPPYFGGVGRGSGHIYPCASSASGRVCSCLYWMSSTTAEFTPMRTSR